MASKKQNKYRINKIKREHGMIKGLLRELTRLSQEDYVHSIIPGEINRNKRPGSFELAVKYETPTGLKLLAKSGVAIQEVFVVTDNPQAVRTFILAREY